MLIAMIDPDSLLLRIRCAGKIRQAYGLEPACFQYVRLGCASEEPVKVNVVSLGSLLTFAAVQWSQGVCTIEFPNPKKERKERK